MDTKILIECVKAYYRDFDNPKISKPTWKNIHISVTSRNCTATLKQCQSKWADLEKSYKRDKDRVTGEIPSPNEYLDDMDDILGHKPSNLKSFTLKTLNTNSHQSLIGNNNNLNCLRALLTKKETQKSPLRTTRKLNERERKRFEMQIIELKREKLELDKQRVEIEKQKVSNDASKADVIASATTLLEKKVLFAFT